MNNAKDINRGYKVGDKVKTRMGVGTIEFFAGTQAMVNYGDLRCSIDVYDIVGKVYSRATVYSR